MTKYLRFPDKASFYATLQPHAFDCHACRGSGTVIVKSAEQVFVDDPDEPYYTVVGEDEYGPCPVCSGTGMLADVRGETFSPLPEGVEAIRIVGPMYESGTYDNQGHVVQAPTLIPGYHVNVLGALPAAWVPYQVFPAAPQGVFG